MDLRLLHHDGKRAFSPAREPIGPASFYQDIFGDVIWTSQPVDSR